MGLFKSRRERELDREVRIRRGVQLIRRTVRELERAQRTYLLEARRARDLGDHAQYGFLRKAIQRTWAQRLLMERQLVSIETARQLKKQAEVNARFAEALLAISKGIGDFTGRIDLRTMQRRFEKALTEARSWEEKMAVFLDMAAESFGAEEPQAAEGLSEEEVDRLVEACGEGTQAAVDSDIKKGLDEIRKELGEA